MRMTLFQQARRARLLAQRTVTAMHVMRCLLWSLVAAAAMSGQALAQDGLQRFERDIKPQLELDSFTYGSARALGNTGFVLNDVVAVIPATPQTGDKPSTVRIERIT